MIAIYRIQIIDYYLCLLKKWTHTGAQSDQASELNDYDNTFHLKRTDIARYKLHKIIGISFASSC